MKITYTPYFNDSTFKELSIKIPAISISGYKPKYTTKYMEEDIVTPVESQIEEIRTSKSSVKKEDIKHQNKETTDESQTGNRVTLAIKFKSKKEFTETMTPIYEELLIKKGLNPVFAKALVAQDGLESAWGSRPSGKFNFGGIKGKGSIKRTREVINGKDIYINDSFRDFDSLEDYANYKVNLLNNNRYRAFSGDLSEFADRVSKGGYATDPNYSRVLNNIIASAKHGGVLKFQEGGVAEGNLWLKNWYKNRLPQIESNIRSNLPFPIPITGSLGYHILVHNIDSATADIDPSKVPDDSRGVYYPFGRRIYLRTDSPSTAVHEWTHSSEPNAQIREISKIKEKLRQGFYDISSSIPVNEYLDSSEEIYARLMQLRHALGVDPKHKFTNEEVEALKRDVTKWTTLTRKLKGEDGVTYSTVRFDKNGKVIATDPYKEGYKPIPGMRTLHIEYDNDKSFNILNRYSTEAIRMLLNDVAQVPEKKDTAIYAKLGLKVPKYQNPAGTIQKPSKTWQVWDQYSNKESIDPNWRAPMLLDTTEKYIPTLNDLIKFTTSYETFVPKPYQLGNNITGKKQTLIGYGFADSELIKKYKNGMPKNVADSIVAKKLSEIYDYFKNNTKWFNNLSAGIKLALVDTAYNGRDVQEIIKYSPKLLTMLENGITNPEQLVKEMNHSANEDNWLGVRSAARRAMVLDKYDWQPKKVDKHGRALREDIPVGKKDWEVSPYYKKY